jgi:large subunit ribosomal protein L4
MNGNSEMKAVYYDATGAEKGQIDLRPDVFGVVPNPTVIHQAVVAHLANKRQGTAATKGRSFVHGTNKKPFRQKKTGNARRGDLKTNVQRGGGVSGGPSPRDYTQKMPKKQRRLAMMSALSIRASESAVLAIEDLSLESGKTKEVATILKSLGLGESRVVLVTHNPSESLIRASRNLPKVHLVPVTALHPYEIMWAQRVVFTDSALAQIAGGAE